MRLQWYRNEPVLTPAGKKNWRLVHDYVRIIDDEYIIVPAGFITDLASVPRFLWPLIPPYGRHTGAAIFHDWFYRSPGISITRKKADKIMLHIMKEDGCSFLKRWTIYIGLRLFGGPFFRKRS